MKAKTSARLAMLLLASAMLPTLLVTSGCVALLAGAGAGATVAYVRGDLDATLNGGFDKSVRAVNKAIAQLEFAKISENKDTLQATIVARNGVDKRVEFYVVKFADDATKLKIRVGTFGDDTLQVSILEKVKSNL